MTIFEAYNSTKKKLRDAGIEDDVFEAKQIIKHITGLNSAQILANYNNRLTTFQQNNLTAIIHQRQVRYPLQYIFGQWDFYGRGFYVGPGVLVPRADTEILVETALAFIKDKQNPKIADLCSGSGCIGITLGLEKPDAKVELVEKYNAAFSYLEKNIQRNKALNCTALKGDIFSPENNGKEYDLIVSNPPYIPPEEMKEISPETTFEPETALKADDGGMEYYKAIIKNYSPYLKNGGMLAFEVGINASQKVAALLKSAGYINIDIKKDLNGIERTVSGIKTEV